MLSVSVVNSGHADSGYYKSEGYYMAGTDKQQANAKYIGQAAKEAGLIGRVDDDTFAKLLDGTTPDGNRIGKMRDGEWVHRPGLDMTFSAPKSVSIAALVGDDQLIRAAHEAAVTTALDYVEKHVAQSRRYSNGRMEAFIGSKLIGGAFMHDTSRALDPHLHTHAVIANMALGPDGKYRALLNDEVFKNKLVIGQLYRNELANTLEAAGYDVVRDQKTGFFEIANVSKDVMTLFSTRRQEIEQALEERNLAPTAVNSHLAALATRATKAPIERGELDKAWKDEAQSVGFKYQQPERAAQLIQEDPKASLEVAIAKTKAQMPNPDKSDTKAAVTFAIAHLSERNSIYSLQETTLTAMRFDTKLAPTSIQNELADRTARKEIFVLQHKGKTYLTDERTVQLERENVAMMKKLQNGPQMDVRSFREKLSMRSPDGAVEQRLRDTSLTKGQQDAAAMILTGSDRVVGVQGLAGTGKTFMLATAVRHLEKAGYAVEGFAPSRKAVAQLGEAVPNSRTIESSLVFHANLPKAGDKTGTVLFVDEASMISSADMNRLLQMVQSKDYVRVVFVGDVKQLDAVGAGPSFRQLQDAGMQSAQMLDVQRQNTLEGRIAVLHAASGDVRAAFEGLSKVHETGGTRTDIAQTVAAKYLERSPEDRANTAVIVLTNDMRWSVNETIQTGLREQGVLKGEAHIITTLDNRQFTAAEAGEVTSYLEGDLVMAHKDIKRAGMKEGELYRVTGINEDKRSLSLTSPKGDKSVLVLDHNKTSRNKLVVFQERDERFFSGDQVTFKITDNNQNVINGNTGQVKQVTKTHVTYTTDEGKRQTLPRDSLAVKGMQLAYSATAHAYQGSTIDRVLLAIESSEILATLKAFYVGLSRMREDTELVTNDVAKLTQSIESQTGERVTAIEVMSDQTRLEQVAPQRAETGKEQAYNPEPTRGQDDADKARQSDLTAFQNGARNEPEKERKSDAQEVAKNDRSDDARSREREERQPTPDEIIAKSKIESEKIEARLQEQSERQHAKVQEIQEMTRGQRTR